jgi:hypothetical protein
MTSGLFIALVVNYYKRGVYLKVGNVFNNNTRSLVKAMFLWLVAGRFSLALSLSMSLALRFLRCCWSTDTKTGGCD